MRGSVCLICRILSLMLAVMLGLGSPCLSQDIQAPPSKPPEQAPPAPSPPAAQPEKPQTAPQKPEAPGETAEEAPSKKEEAPAPKGATLKGKVLGTDRKTPLPAAVVYAMAPDETVISSQPSDVKGGYYLGGLPPGTYRLAVESEGGLYILESAVGITSAQTFNVNLATVPAASAMAGIPGVAAPTRGYCYIVQGGSSGGAMFWRTPQGIIVLAASAAAVGLILARRGRNEKVKSVSPSVP